jgi:hypothetical protein
VPRDARHRTMPWRQRQKSEVDKKVQRSAASIRGDSSLTRTRDEPNSLRCASQRRARPLAFQPPDCNQVCLFSKKLRRAQRIQQTRYARSIGSLADWMPRSINGHAVVLPVHAFLYKGAVIPRTAFSPDNQSKMRGLDVRYVNCCFVDVERDLC